MPFFAPEKFTEEAIARLKTELTDKAIIAASGGVDSTVAAVLAARAAGDNLLAIYVNTGYMRLNETKFVSSMLENLGVQYKVIDASKRFYEGLQGIIDPEEKRKIIGELFIRVFEEEARKYGGKFLVQGTIAPDWIESGGGLRDTIKSHHNVGGLPEDMEMKLCEPIRELYKDEVRSLAEFLKVSVAHRQPFPGPGLAVRVMGEATPERTEVVRQACHIAEEEMELASERNEMELPWQYFAVLIPVKTVGVQGDVRAYGNTIAVRAVQSYDAMTAQALDVPYPVLKKISERITRELKSDVNRVVYDITDKPPGTIEWE
ncbi:MAG: glutamine-hydrolyzing GMP synthase subunit GuaA [Methanobacteriota archaeon]|jgi:GMP synthase (glutamine-hydrolysing)|nr:MAG: glutamine-hydrolyzing GMP synthase subunit GuaA [Euryarchaeota archaeon]